MSHANGGAKVQGNDLSWLNWPVIGGNVTVITLWHSLWDHVPTLTTLYTGVTIVFIIFQMADKLGFLDGIKQRSKSRKERRDAAKIRKEPKGDFEQHPN